MFEKDDYWLPNERYEYNTLFWYDGPQLWGRYDTVKNELRLFVNIDDNFAVSGVIGEVTYQLMLNNCITLKDVWENYCWDFRKHVWGSADDDRGHTMRLRTAIGLKPLGDAYLRAG